MSDNSFTPKIRVRTLGCKVNFCDSNLLLEALAEAGFERAPEGRSADVELINTCAVTARSVAKARTLIRRVRSENTNAPILVTGCAARLKEDAFKGVGEADGVFPWPKDAVEWLKKRFGRDASPRVQSQAPQPGRTRAFVKIQDGCRSCCSYCIVPTVRGAPKSVPPQRVLQLIRRALEGHHNEIVLCGIHLGQYGRDRRAGSLADMMREIALMQGTFRIRLSSIEPLEATEELLAVMASSDRFCPHLHLPLQSGSDRVLAAMGRPYTSREFLEVVDRSRRFLNNPAITTDIMVGFPGETEEDHRATLEVIRTVGFARGHVFIFSPREGTPAARMPGRMSAPEARRRSAEARAACARTAADFRRGLAGTIAAVVVEKASGGWAEGLCGRYQRVRVPGPRELLGRIVDLYIIRDSVGGVLEGRLLEPESLSE